MEFRPLHKRLVAFSVPEKAKIGSIYIPNRLKGMYSFVQPIWVLAHAKDCKQRWAKGTKAFITDGFELEPTDFNLWDQHRKDPEFQSLRDYINAVGIESKVKTQLVAEGSILAIED